MLPGAHQTLLPVPQGEESEVERCFMSWIHEAASIRSSCSSLVQRLCNSGDGETAATSRASGSCMDRQERESCSEKDQLMPPVLITSLLLIKADLRLLSVGILASKAADRGELGSRDPRLPESLP